MTYDQSTFIEPLACVVRAQRLADLQRDQTLLVLGCGMSGLLQIKLAKTMNCTIFATDVNKERLKFALQFGADLTMDASENVAELLAAQNRKKADVVMLCTSSLAAVAQAWKCVDRGGAIVFFAVPEPDKKVNVPINEFWMKEIRILTSYYCGPPDITAAIDLLSKGNIAVDDMITHALPLTDIARGYQLVAEGNASIKVIIKPNQH
jgi:L-iditol 2-dehydrogenase